MRAYDSEVCSVRACEITPVCTYVTARYVARVRSGVSVKIGHFGHTLGACRDNHQHKPQKDKGQNRTKRSSFTLKLGYLLKL